jgi:feruloyl esterase
MKAGRARGAARIRAMSSIAMLAAAAVAPAIASAVDCSLQSLNALHTAHLQVTSARVVPAALPRQEYCDVKGSVATRGEGAGPGSAGFELLLPAHWNGKYMFGGSRGEGGSLQSSANPVDLQQFMVAGYASVTTDDGHPQSDRHWFFTRPGQGDMPKLVDFFYRAVHQVTLATKDLVRTYYAARSISRSYFDGCSNGGREGVMVAARYPDDYDGVIAGSSWLDPAGNALADLKNVKALIGAPIPLSKFAQIDAAILAQCDAADGTRDGLIQNPAACSFKPQSLVPGVLTSAQARALDLYFSSVRDMQGNLIYPGMTVSNLEMQFGTASAPMVELSQPPAHPDAAQPWGKGPAPHLWRSAGGVILVLGYRDPKVDMNNTVEKQPGVVGQRVLQTLYSRLRADITDDPQSLQRFFARGGKLLMYHGLSDATISPYISVWFYEDLAAQRGGYAAAQRNARLFLVPDMEHCSDGPAPVRFDTLTALDNWVEHGQGPDDMTSFYTNGRMSGRTLPLCKFPEMPRYKGNGDIRNAQNWACSPRDRSMLETGLNGAEAGLSSRNRHTTLVKGTPGAVY